jgi:hypothetical protein
LNSAQRTSKGGFTWGLPSSIPQDSAAHLTGVAPEDGTGAHFTGAAINPDLVNYGVLWRNILDKNRPLGKMF